MPESGLPGDEAGVGLAHATHPDELMGYASGQYGGDPQHDNACQQTRLPVQAMYGMPVRGCNERRCIKNMTTAVEFRGESTKPESWNGFTT